MPQDVRLLSAEEFLLATLVGKLAVMAALATMLARYHRFRHILIFERRDWPDRLAFALGLALPLTLGVVSRLLLNYDAADLMLDPHLQAGFLPALAGCGLCEVSPVSTVPPGNAHGGTPSRRRPANTPAGPVTIASATNGPACSRGSGSRAASTWSDLSCIIAV